MTNHDNIMIHFTRIVKYSSTDEVDTFGELDGKVRIQRGWLSEEMMIQFKLKQNAITLYKKKHIR